MSTYKSARLLTTAQHPLTAMANPPPASASISEGTPSAAAAGTASRQRVESPMLVDLTDESMEGANGGVLESRPARAGDGGIWDQRAAARVMPPATSSTVASFILAEVPTTAELLGQPTGSPVARSPSSGGEGQPLFQGMRAGLVGAAAAAHVRGLVGPSDRQQTWQLWLQRSVQRVALDLRCRHSPARLVMTTQGQRSGSSKVIARLIVSVLGVFSGLMSLRLVGWLSGVTSGMW